MARKLIKKQSKPQKVVKKFQPATPGAARSSASVAAVVALPVPTGEYTEGVGRRKTASARVRLYHQAGDFVVNGKAIGQYFNTLPQAHLAYMRPFDLTNTKGKFTVSVRVSGSGAQAQLGAVIHGISRALVAYDPTLRTALKPEGLLTRDDRMKETRKVGMGGKARRKRQSPKR